MLPIILASVYLHAAATIRAYEMHPERGRLLERINPWPRESSGPSPAKKSRSNNNESQKVSYHQIKCTSCEQGVVPSIEATIGVVSRDNIGKTTNIKCNGHAISILPYNPYWVLVLNVQNVPCLCPAYLLEKSAIDAVQSYTSSLTDKRKSAFCPSIENITFTSVDARRGDVQGHLIVEGPQMIRGRVVDNTMIECLKAGCLREGKHSKEAYYTLQRKYTVVQERLKGEAHIVIVSGQDMLLSPADRNDIKQLIDWGESLVESMLVYHRSKNEAVTALDDASNLLPPTISERMVQIAIGGDPDSMMIGKFIPCEEAQQQSRCFSSLCMWL